MYPSPVFKPARRADLRSGFDNAPEDWVYYDKPSDYVRMEPRQKHNDPMPKQWHDPEFFLYSGRPNAPHPPRDYLGRTTQGPQADSPERATRVDNSADQWRTTNVDPPRDYLGRTTQGQTWDNPQQIQHMDHPADQWLSTKNDPPRDYLGRATQGPTGINPEHTQHAKQTPDNWRLARQDPPRDYHGQYDPPVDYTGRPTHGAPLNGYLGHVMQNDHSKDYRAHGKDPTDTHSGSRGKHKRRHQGRGDHKNRRDNKKRMSGFDMEPGMNDPSCASKSMDELLKNRRDSMTGCHQFLRYATTLFTFIVFIAGAGLLGLGIYILGSDYGAKQMSEVLGNDLYQIAAYVLIATGSLLVLISVCGCCGAMRESRIMLGVFIFAIATLIVALVAAAAMVFVFRQKMEGDIVHSMEDVLLNRYGVDLTKHSENRVVTDMWNWLQRELKCCGVIGDVNSTTSWAIYRRSEWYQGFITGMIYVPESCCDPSGDMNICTGITPIEGPPTKGPPLTANLIKNPHLYTSGCYDELVHYIQDHAVIIGVASIASVVIMLFGLFFAVYLCRRVNMLYY